MFFNMNDGTPDGEMIWHPSHDGRPYALQRQLCCCNDACLWLQDSRFNTSRIARALLGCPGGLTIAKLSSTLHLSVPKTVDYLKALKKSIPHALEARGDPENVRMWTAKMIGNWECKSCLAPLCLRCCPREPHETPSLTCRMCNEKEWVIRSRNDATIGGVGDRDQKQNQKDNEAGSQKQDSDLATFPDPVAKLDKWRRATRLAIIGEIMDGLSKLQEGESRFTWHRPSDKKVNSKYEKQMEEAVQFFIEKKKGWGIWRVRNPDQTWGSITVDCDDSLIHSDIGIDLFHVIPETPVAAIGPPGGPTPDGSTDAITT